MYVEGFASKLKKARENTGFSQRDVEAETGISQSLLSKYETGRIEPNIEILGILAEFYQVSTDWLLGINIQNEKYKRKESSRQNPLKFYVSARDNIVNENGNVYIELTPDQMRKLKEATDNA